MTKSLGALIVEDSEDDALLLVRELAVQGYEVEWERVQTASDMHAALNGRSWDVVISDFNMPSFSAPEALRVKQEFDADLPFIVVSGTVGEDVAVETMKAGAHDYLLKGNLARLGQAIEREVRDAGIRREHRLAINKIEHLNRVLGAIRNVNQLIVTEKDRQRLICRAAELLVETRGYASALCASIDEDRAPTIVAHSMVQDDGTFAPQHAILAAGLTSCMQQALESDGPVVIDCDTSGCGGCPLFAEHTSRQRMAKRIAHDGAPLAVLSIALPRGIAPDAEELGLLDEMAGDIGFALFGIQQAEDLAAESALLAAAVDAMPDSFFLFEPATGRAVRWNEKFRSISGYTDDEIAALPAPQSYYDHEDLLRGAAAMETLARDNIAEVQLDLLTRDGARIPTEYVAATIAAPGDRTLALSIGRDITERRRAEERLKANERKFRTVFHAVTEGIILLDPAHKRFVLANQAICRMLGYGEDELLKLWVADIHPAEQLPMVIDAFEKQLRGDLRVAPEMPVRRKDGSVFYADISSTAVDMEGRALLLGCFRDVTERVQAAATLEQNEEHFRKVFEGAHDMIALVDDEARIVLANPAWHKVFGEQLHAWPNPSTLIHRDDLESVSAAWKRLVTDDQPIDRMEYRLKLDNGSWAVIVSNAFSVDLQGGQKYCIISRDVTETRHAEEQRRAVFESSADHIMLLDLEHRVQLVNRTEAGLSPEEVVGTPLYELADAKTRETVRETLDRVLRDQARQQYDTVYVRPDGTKVHFHSVVNPIIISGEIAGSVVVSRDISERKQLQDQIAQSDRLASMGMLAAGVAHEINNPLAYMLYNLESLTEDLPRLSSALRRSLAVIVGRVGNEEWERLMGKEQELLNPAMLDDILARFKDALHGSHRIRDVARGLGTFSRVERDRLVPVALMHVIEVAINMSFNEIKYRAKLVKDYGTTATIMANDGRLSQVFLNLLVNAAHSITEGDVQGNQIRVRTWQQGDEVFAEVRDSGKGISAEHLPHLFEPFFTTKELGIGTGLGLPISRTIVEEYGGRIEVESKVGEGTRFVVRLPVNKASKPEEAAPGVQAAIPAGVRGRILIVDDEAGIRVAMTRLLRGHDVVQAVSGVEAQKILEADQAFDLILCDMMMPLMSGVDLHKWLSTTHPDLARQVVFITGGAFTPGAREHLSKVDNIRIEKPFDVANLKKIVSELIVAHRSRGS